MIRAHVYITGKVQGVFYRAWTQKNAKELGLTGWVQNLTDGRVEAVFEGSKEKVDEMIKRCNEGSKAANVTHIDVIEEKATGEFEDFQIKS